MEEKTIDKEIADLEEQIAELKAISKDRIINVDDELKELEEKVQQLQIATYKNLTAWDKVNIARNSNRPTALDYINNICDTFIELHGDRCFKDDKSIVCGLASINGRNVTIVAEQKGRNTKENIERNFGMPNPEAYRKSLRFMKEAEKFKRPIITFIDTKGAYPGIGAEERGQGEAIARNLMEMSNLKTPIIAIVIGEGSSGGALAIGVGDKVLMLENAIYSILSPEGYSSILWKDSTRAKEASEIMKLTANDLLELGIIDEVLDEPIGGASKNIKAMSTVIKEKIITYTNELSKINVNDLIERRYKKYRVM